MQNYQEKFKQKKQATQKTDAHAVENYLPNKVRPIEQASVSPQSLNVQDVMSLQSTIGNQAVAQLFQENSANCTRSTVDDIIQRTVQRTQSNLNKPQAIQRKNGLPDKLKNSLEGMSGMDLSNVNVHYNSSKPKSVGALAYAQNNNIFLGRGQEKHLPHEAWHVVQQRQGRVKPTTSLNGFSINDDKHLEKEADVMGRKALNNRSSQNTQLKKKPTDQQNSKSLQRKVEYKNPNEWMIEEVKVALKEKIYKRRKVLFSEEEQATVTKIFEDEYFGKLFNALSRLSYSEIDYGTFDLNSDQHLLLLYHEIKKHLNKPLLASPETEVEDSEKESKKQSEEQKEHFAKSPYPGLTFELAILGAGAATAYYLASKGNVDKYNTIVIGEKQPWAFQRGPGVINHPMHMITALREEVGLGKEELAPREDFSKVVEEVINKYVIHREDSKIKKVAKVDGKEDTKFYAIEIQNGVKFYAQKVVVGLGIGPHKKPKDQEEGQAAGRVMDMDEFQRRASEIRKTVVNASDITVVVGGGNAGIDSVMTSIREGFKIIWATGSQRPALLPGTDNEYVEDEYEKVIKKEDSKIQEVIKKYANKAIDNPKKGEMGEKPIIVETGGGSRPADYFVYALGPDIGKVSGILDKESIRDHLVPTYDKNSQFGDGGGTVTGLEVENDNDKTSLEIIGGTAFRMAGDIKYDYMKRLNENQLKEAIAKMSSLEEELEVVGYVKEAKLYQSTSLGDITKIMQAEKSTDLPVLAVAPKQSSIKSKLQEAKSKKANRYLSCLRFVDTYESLIAEFRAKVLEYLKEIEKDPRSRASDPRTALSNFQKVVESLPLNIAVNDQLTTVRSQIEANAGFVPDYVIDDVNFATDSITVLSIYISANYPNLPDKEVDMWADRIVRWRRPSEEERKKYTSLHGPLPNPQKKPRENAKSFSAWFKKRLQEENEKYS